MVESDICLFGIAGVLLKGICTEPKYSTMLTVHMRIFFFRNRKSQQMDSVN